ncbi:MAG TPA: cysteine desulfurase family protein, partial [Steroidobacteraceae bacterium]|nr:cysteine desulfurase family protein [Steroidobacteraceae bacterium]
MVYLDHNATTPLDARVLAAMQPYLAGPYANPSSSHRYGRAARDAIETARAQVAALVGCAAGEVTFTSGGTEANNLAIKGIAARNTPGRLLHSAIEHPSVVEPMQALARAGWRVETIAVDTEGRIDAAALARQLEGGDVRLVSCMLANNETGVLQDLARTAALARGAAAPLHVDAVQAAGKVAVNFAEGHAALMSLSSHKIHGPKGAGALVVDPVIDLEPLLHGGGQERGLRGGTENVAALVGFGAAAELAQRELDARAAHAKHLRAHLEAALVRIPGLTLFSALAPR